MRLNFVQYTYFYIGYDQSLQTCVRSIINADIKVLIDSVLCILV